MEESRAFCGSSIYRLLLNWLVGCHILFRITVHLDISDFLFCFSKRVCVLHCQITVSNHITVKATTHICLNGRLRVAICINMLGSSVKLGIDTFQSSMYLHYLTSFIPAGVADIWSGLQSITGPIQSFNDEFYSDLRIQEAPSLELSL